MRKTRLFSWLLVIALLLPVSPAFANETVRSRSMVVETVSGSDISMTKGAAKTFAVRVGTKLAKGYTVTTGKKSTVGIKMDDNSVVTMNESTKIDISKQSSREIKLTVVSGTISVNAGKQAAGNNTTIKAGNTTMGIRGTTLTISHAPGVVRTILLEGELEIDTPDGTFTMKSGHVMDVYDGVGDQPPETDIYPLEIDKIQDSFTLELIKEHLELLLELGILTEEEAETLDGLIEAAKAREEEAEAERLAGLLDIENEKMFLEEEEEEEPEPIYYDPPGDMPVTTQVDLASAFSQGRNAYIPSGTELPLESNFIIPQYRTLTVNSGATLTIGAGDLTVYGTLKNFSDATIKSLGGNLVLGNYANLVNGGGGLNDAGIIEAPISVVGTASITNNVNSFIRANIVVEPTGRLTLTNQHFAQGAIHGLEAVGGAVVWITAGGDYIDEPLYRQGSIRWKGEKYEKAVATNEFFDFVASTGTDPEPWNLRTQEELLNATSGTFTLLRDIDIEVAPTTPPPDTPLIPSGITLEIPTGRMLTLISDSSQGAVNVGAITLDGGTLAADSTTPVTLTGNISVTGIGSKLTNFTIDSAITGATGATLELVNCDVGQGANFDIPLPGSNISGMFEWSTNTSLWEYLVYDP
jgi:hypothetical protein